MYVLKYFYLGISKKICFLCTKCMGLADREL